MSVESAVCYRMVLHIAGITVANKWGYMPESLGYKEAERIFNNKYKLISFTQLKDEIILSWCAESVKRKNKKMSMSLVLDIDEVNEEHRPLFNKVTENVKDEYKKNNLNGISKIIKGKGEKINEVIVDIDSAFNKVLEKARAGENNLHFSNEEMEKIKSAMIKLESLEGKANKYNLDTESFLEDVLKRYNKKMLEINIPQRFYNEEVARIIKTNFFARLNTVKNGNNQKSRNRTKKSIFDKIQDGSISMMSINDFLLDYNELMNLYEECNSEITNIDELLMFYDIESKYNLIFYNNIVMDLVEDTTLRKEELANKVSKLALSDLCIYRSSMMKATVNKVINEFHSKENKTYKEAINEIKGLLQLKNKIVADMLLINSLEFESLKENVFSIISNAAKEEIHNQLKKVDIERYLDIESNEEILYKVFKNIKYLLEYNKRILLGRNSIVNKIEV